MSKGNSRTPAVFIVYSHDDEPHKQWVAKLAQALLKKGFEVKFDQDVEPGKDVATYSMLNCQKADKVLVICTPAYKRKADRGKGTVGFEVAYLLERMRKRPRAHGVIPVFRGVPVGSDGKPRRDKARPQFLNTGGLYVDFSRDSDFEQQLVQLREQLGGPARSSSRTAPCKFVHAVLLMADIIGFSSLPNHAQQLVMSDLRRYFSKQRKRQYLCLSVFELLDGAGVVWESGQGHAESLKLAKELCDWLKSERPGAAIRIGIHVGDAMRFIGKPGVEGSWFGAGCNDCRRIAQIGAGGQIVLSEAFINDCQSASSPEARKLLLNQIEPARKDPAIEVFPARGQGGKVRFYSESPQIKQPPTGLLVLDHAAKRIAGCQRRIGGVFQQIIVKKWHVAAAKADLRITLWAPDPALPEILQCTDYRWFAHRGKADKPSATIYSLSGDGEGPPGRAFRQAQKGPLVIPWLPDPDNNDAAYIEMLGKLCGTLPKTVKDASRRARAFACLPFWSPGTTRTGEPLGVLCLDSMIPFIPRQEMAGAGEAVKQAVREFYDSMKQQETMAFDDLAFAWLVRI